MQNLQGDLAQGDHRWGVREPLCEVVMLVLRSESTCKDGGRGRTIQGADMAPPKALGRESIWHFCAADRGPRAAEKEEENGGKEGLKRVGTDHV